MKGDKAILIIALSLVVFLVSVLIYALYVSGVQEDERRTFCLEKGYSGYRKFVEVWNPQINLPQYYIECVRKAIVNNTVVYEREMMLYG